MYSWNERGIGKMQQHPQVMLPDFSRVPSQVKREKPDPSVLCAMIKKKEMANSARKKKISRRKREKKKEKKSKLNYMVRKNRNLKRKLLPCRISSLYPSWSTAVRAMHGDSLLRQ